MKKYFIVFILVILFIQGCSQSTSENKKVLNIASEFTFKPFEYVDNGEYVGFDIDLINAIAKDLNCETKIQNLGFDALIPALDANKVDLLICGMSITEERRKVVNFSDPYYKSGVSVVVKDGVDINSFEDLRNKKIAVQIGNTGAYLAKDIEGAQIKSLDEITKCFIELENRNVDAVLIDKPVAENYIKSSNKPLRLLDITLSSEDYGIAVSKNNKELLKQINHSLARLKSNGEYDEIYDKWFGNNNIVKKEKRGFDFNIIAKSFPLLLQGAWLTIIITFISVLIGFLIGLLVSVLKLSNKKILKIIASIYVDITRGTPLLVQIFMIFYALPRVLDININPFVAAIIACSLNSGAYVAEIFRSGFQSIDKGQTEAGRSLGMNRFQTLYHILFPQAFKRIIPQLGNEFIAMLKDSSLVSVIGFEELTRKGQLVISNSYAYFEIWSVVAILYLIMTFSISRLVAYLEKKFRIDD